MTSDQIKVNQCIHTTSDSCYWLAEIALQLAIMNERNARLDTLWGRQADETKGVTSK